MEELFKKSLFPLWLVTFLYVVSGTFYSLCYQAESFDFLSLRYIDDTIFQISLMKYRSAVARGDVFQLFFMQDYAYGNLYWLLMMVVTLPGALMDSEHAMNLGPRLFSWLCYIGCFVQFYRLCVLRGYERWAISLGLLFLTTASALFGPSVRFHNHTFLAFLCISSLVVLFSKKEKSWWKSSAIMGLALGVKIVALGFLPVFLIFFFEKHRNWKVRASALGVIFLTAVFSYCPGLLFYWIGDDRYQGAKDSLMYIIFNQTKPNRDLLDYWNHFRDGVFKGYFQFFVWIVVLITALLLQVKRKENQYFFVAFLWSVLAILIITHFTRHDYSSLPSYAMPVLFVICLSIVSASHWNFRLGMVFFILWIGNFFWNYKTIEFHRLESVYSYESPATKQKLKNYDVYKESVSLRDGDHITMESQLVFPLDVKRRFDRIVYLFDSDFDFYKSDVYVFGKQGHIATESCDVLAPRFAVSFERCEDIKALAAGKISGFDKIFEDNDIVVIRSKYRASNP